MKIAFITNNYEPIVSGITTSINTFAESLNRRGHRVYIFAPDYPNYRERNKSVQRVFSVKLYYKEKYPLPVIRSSTLSQLLTGLSIDVLHSHHPFGLGQTAIRAAKHLSLPIICTYHTMYEEYCHYIPFIGRRYLRGYIIRKALNYINHCNVVIAPTDPVKDLLIRRGCKSPVVVLPTGISHGIVGFEHTPQASLQARRGQGDDLKYLNKLPLNIFDFRLALFENLRSCLFSSILLF